MNTKVTDSLITSDNPGALENRDESLILYNHEPTLSKLTQNRSCKTNAFCTIPVALLKYHRKRALRAPHPPLPSNTTRSFVLIQSPLMPRNSHRAGQSRDTDGWLTPWLVTVSFRKPMQQIIPCSNAPTRPHHFAALSPSLSDRLAPVPAIQGSPQDSCQGQLKYPSLIYYTCNNYTNLFPYQKLSIYHHQCDVFTH